MKNFLGEGGGEGEIKKGRIVCSSKVQKNVNDSFNLYIP
jgi:hypothetical protein